MYLLDTDVLIDIQRGHQPAIDWFVGLPKVPTVPGFVAMELFFV
jgi:predicted nucleic acid-binding protein